MIGETAVVLALYAKIKRVGERLKTGELKAGDIVRALNNALDELMG